MTGSGEPPAERVARQIDATIARAARARTLAREQRAAAELHRALAERADARAYGYLLREWLVETHEAAASHHALAADLHDEHVVHLVAKAVREGHLDAGR